MATDPSYVYSQPAGGSLTLPAVLRRSASFQCGPRCALLCHPVAGRADQGSRSGTAGRPVATGQRARHCEGPDFLGKRSPSTTYDSHRRRGLDCPDGAAVRDEPSLVASAIAGRGHEPAYPGERSPLRSVSPSAERIRHAHRRDRRSAQVLGRYGILEGFPGLDRRVTARLAVGAERPAQCGTSITLTGIGGSGLSWPGRSTRCLRLSGFQPCRSA